MSEVENVTRDEVKQGLADDSIILIDVREPHEWAAGHIDGAVLMPLSTFDAADLPAPSQKKIVFQCNSGKRTLMALQAAHAGGRTDINAHYEGSFQDWRNAGEPIARD